MGNKNDHDLLIKLNVQFSDFRSYFEKEIGSLSCRLDAMAKKYQEAYETSMTSDQYKEMQKVIVQFPLIQKIVYGLVGVALVAVGKALVGLVVH